MFGKGCRYEKELRGKRILTVEDEPAFCSLLTGYLNLLGIAKFPLTY
ncbi:hypothetical protein [Xenorhabdus japonica]|uniref:Uncharacterized protein n=1 Tax=Xenorhabdus japonica TaxID=53341 RepID=A0A1I4ZW24_9GAMM|nr:hypothetical protein [Xenorhabdus japonica]SFN54428.1 hypothetical protein SAMN05421579_10814 [Xenorhabdus japonica]